MDELKEVISGSPEFETFRQSIISLFDKWELENRPRLQNIAVGDKPKPLIETLSENLLETFRSAHLLDAYDIFQHLMDYWAETMQDDLYMLVSDGWKRAVQPRLLVEEKGKKSKEKPDLAVGKKKFKTDLLPTSLVVARYFATEQSAIDSLNADLEAISRSAYRVGRRAWKRRRCAGSAESK